MAMLFTHLLTGILLGLAISSLFSPENYSIILTISIISSTFPDFDVLFNHRKTLHFPIYSIILTVSSFILYLIFNHMLLLYIFIFSISTLIHFILDLFGSGDHLKPWELEEEKSKTLYNHISNNWVKTKNYYYDGSKLDALILIILSISILNISNNIFLIYLSIFLTILGILYSFIRKPIANKYTSAGNTSFSKALIDLITYLFPRK